MAAAEPKIDVCKLCTKCEGRGPLTDTPELKEKEEADIVADHIERLTQERRAGRWLTPSKLDHLEWTLLLVWDECVAAYERAHQARVERMFEMLVARTQR